MMKNVPYLAMVHVVRSPEGSSKHADSSLLVIC